MEFKINKPIRLIELFAGIGAQAKALEMLGVKFEHYRICEFDKYAVASYNTIHGTHFHPTDIRDLRWSDLGVTDTDKYCYILTYSFPCQDLSVAGKQRGMTKGGGTRSGLLWEVERLLTECVNGGGYLPAVLIMGNVKQVHSEKNIEVFKAWINRLEELGYSNYWQDLNATGFEIPQNRIRCFMVSILGGGGYKFPKPKELTVKLKDLLEPEVDEKYYLSEKQIRSIMQSAFTQRRNAIVGGGVMRTLTAHDSKEPTCVVLYDAEGEEVSTSSTDGIMSRLKNE